MNVKRFAWIAALCVAQAGCGASGCVPPGPDLCAQDRLGCGGDPVVFEPLPGCTLSGELPVTVGEGEAAFAGLAEGAGPAVHYGFQGGQHVFLGFRVGGLALDRYDQVKVTRWLGQGEACGPGEHAPGLLPAGCTRDLGYREVVLGGTESALRVVDGGVVEEFGLLVILDEVLAGLPAVLAVEVEDPCGRVGVGSHGWTPR